MPAFLITAFEIVNHSVRWSVTLFERTEILYPYPVDVQIVAAPATAYETVFKLSLLVSGATVVFLVGLLLWRKWKGELRARAERRGDEKSRAYTRRSDRYYLCSRFFSA